MFPFPASVPAMARITLIPFFCSTLILAHPAASGKEMPSPYPAPEPGLRSPQPL